MVQRDSTLATLQPHTITELQVHPSTEITAAARRVLVRAGIDVVFIDGRGQLVARLLVTNSRAGERRLAWYALTHDPARRLDIARQMIAGKIHNQRVVLLSRQKRLKSAVVQTALDGMKRCTSEALVVESLERLRGVEGLAARHHFSAFGAVLTNPLFSFTGRNRRPPRDPVNAALSFGYTRLVARCQGAALRAGLDLYLGCLHEAGRGATVLAFDLAEEFRPVVDGVVLALFNRRQLVPGDFRRPTAEEVGDLAGSEEAIYLDRTSATILIRALEARLRERGVHPIQENHWPLGELIIEQARQLARIATGEQEHYHALRLGVG